MAATTGPEATAVAKRNVPARKGGDVTPAVDGEKSEGMTRLQRYDNSSRNT